MVNKLKKIFLREPFFIFASNIIFNDKSDYEYSRRRSNLFLKTQQEIIYLPVIVDTKLFEKRDKISCKRKLGISKNKTTIIFVGRVNENKCSDILEELIKKNKDKQFIIIGRNEESKLLENPPNNVLYITNKSSKELVDYYNASDLGFFVYRFQGGGIGFAPIECLSCGTPIVVASRKGIKESKALLISKINFKSINKKIEDFVKLSKSEKKNLSTLAVKYAEDNYSSSSWVEKYAQAYLG